MHVVINCSLYYNFYVRNKLKEDLLFSLQTCFNFNIYNNMKFKFEQQYIYLKKKYIYILIKQNYFEY